MTHRDEVFPEEHPHQGQVNWHSDGKSRRATPVRENTGGSAMGPLNLTGWCRILDAVADQREALDHRIWRGDLDDVRLAADVRTWCELSQALIGFLNGRRKAP